jgi:hypothetical protein
VAADTRPDTELLHTVRQSQAAVLDTIRSWATLTERLTGTLRPAVPDLDLPGIVDRTFDLAEQTLAAQHRLARILAGAVTRQVDTATRTIDTEVAALEATIDNQERRAPAPPAEQQRPPQAPVPTAASPKQDRRPDGRTYEERSVEELRERAGELQIEGRSAMTKDELITALRDHRKQRSAKGQATRQDRTPDRRGYEERSIEELRERARELEIEGRSSMSKDELIAALRTR